jgi:hypothetical protein
LLNGQNHIDVSCTDGRARHALDLCLFGKLSNRDPADCSGLYEGGRAVTQSPERMPPTALSR